MEFDTKYFDEQRKKLHQKLQETNSVLIISHEGADIDAVTSSLLLREILKEHYKNISQVGIKLLAPKTHAISGLEELNELENTNSLYVKTVNNIIDSYELLIIVDTETPLRCFPDFDLSKFQAKQCVVIDHHDTNPSDLVPEIWINEKRASATQEVFMTFKYIFPNNFIITDKIAKLTEIGIVADTNSFMYEKVSSETFKIMEELRDKYVVSPEKIIKAMYSIPQTATPILIDVLSNITIEGTMAYAFLSEAVAQKHNISDIRSVKKYFCDFTLRFIQGVTWGFLLVPKNGKWSLSIRSLYGGVDVRKIAEKLGGGGHIYGAGAEIEADTVEEAIEKVKEAIKATNN